MRKDSWFEQDDLRARFTENRWLQRPNITACEMVDSYVEHLYAQCLPVSRAHHTTVLNEIAWASDFWKTKSPLVRTKTGKSVQLGLRFRRFWQRRFGVAAPLDQFRKALTKAEVSEGPVESVFRLHIPRSLVEDFLLETTQCLLWCVRSHRYSERSLSEFGQNARNVVHKGANYIYFHEFSELTDMQALRIPRMKSQCVVFGKRLIFNPTSG